MDKELLKKKLHGQIDAMDDELALQMLLHQTLKYCWEDEEELTPWQMERLEESLRQCDEGKTVAHEEVMKLVHSWISK